MAPRPREVAALARAGEPVAHHVNLALAALWVADREAAPRWFDRDGVIRAYVETALEFDPGPDARVLLERLAREAEDPSEAVGPPAPEGADPAPETSLPVPAGNLRLLSTPLAGDVPAGPAGQVPSVGPDGCAVFEERAEGRTRELRVTAGPDDGL